MIGIDERALNGGLGDGAFPEGCEVTRRAGDAQGLARHHGLHGDSIHRLVAFVVS